MGVDHYENFPVASALCPPALRPAVRAIYAYARTADDIADEGDAPAAERLADLAAYRADLHAVAEGAAPSPRWAAVFAPLAEALARHRLPPALLEDLLDAFAQDVTVTRYADRAALLDYCRRSANPIGRLLLHLYGIDDPRALAQSDAVCSGLQLANFWQDLSVDVPSGRLYIPLDQCAAYGLSEAQLMAREDGAAVRDLIRAQCLWARELLYDGAPLARRIPGRAGWELRAVVQGGLAILRKLEGMHYASLHRRPVLGRLDWLGIAWRSVGSGNNPRAP